MVKNCTAGLETSERVRPINMVFFCPVIRRIDDRSHMIISNAQHYFTCHTHTARICITFSSS